MEVLGLIAGLPGLIEIIKKTAEMASQLKNWKSLAGEMALLLQQLEGLEKTLRDVKDRGTSPSISPSQFASFEANLTQVGKDLTNLSQLLIQCEPSTHKIGTRFMRQAKMFLTGFDKTTKKHIERIRDTRAELTLALVSQVHQGYNQSATKTDLFLQLERTLSPSSSNFIPPKLDTTCDWIWSHIQLDTWVNSPQVDPSDHQKRLFCLYGPKGCGKSVLSASITDVIRARGKIATFFSYWAGSKSQRRFNGFLRTTLWQLLKHLPAEDLSKVAHILMGISSCDDRSLRHALDFTIKTVKSTVYIIIDGIDEAEKDWNDPEDQSLWTVFDLLKTHTNVHILLCGRQTSLGRAIASSSLRLEISQDFLRNDINALIEWHLNNSSKSHIALAKVLVRDSLQAKSEMMFLWVNLVFKELNRSPHTAAMKEILDNTPPTLDEEYNRMFESLMKRSGGSPTRPSVTMKTVKRIFSLILAAPEPLTLVELGYACAAETTIFSAQDDELLAREGLVDSCGDFINESNGHFHFAHASIEEFLTRSLDKWNQADSSILYFRIDRLDSQRTMLESCFNYIRSMDLGYPIHDNSMQSLPQSYPFFRCASRFLPVLLANAGSIANNSALKDFVASKQFCGLVEYIIHTLEMDSWDLFLQYLDLLHSPNGLSIPIPTLMAAVNAELAQREKSLGIHDPRYQTWASIVGILGSCLDRNETGDAQKDATTLPPSLTAEPSTHVGALTVHSTIPNRGIILAQPRPEISALLKFRLLESLRSIPVAALPTWVLILWALQTWNGQNENSSRARPMLETALRRVRKRRTFTESLCLLYLGIMEDHNSQGQHDFDKCSVHRLFRESLDIAQGLSSSPQVEAVIQRALCGVSECFLLHDDRDNAMSFSRQLEQRVCSNGMIKDDSGWLKRMFYRGSAWAKWRVLVLGIHTATLSGHRINEDAGRINQFVLDLHTERNWHENPKILGWQWSHSLILWHSGKIDECQVSLQVMLEHLQGLEGTQYHAEYWLEAVDLLTDCLLAKNKGEEATYWLKQIPAGLILRKPSRVRSLGINLLSLGCIDRALELYECWGRERFLRDFEQMGQARLEHEAAVGRLLEMGIDAKDELGTTALFNASSSGNTTVVESLLDRGIKVEFRHKFGRDTPLTVAIRGGHESIAKLLLDRGADHECQNSYGTTPWHDAIMSGSPSLVETFLKAGSNVDSQMPTGWTPLTLAASEGHASLVQLLLDRGADRLGQDLDGLTPLDWAERNGHDAIVEILKYQVDQRDLEDDSYWLPQIPRHLVDHT